MAKAKRDNESDDSNAVNNGIITFTAFDVTIQGRTPLLQNRLPDSLNLTKAEKAGLGKVDHTEADRNNWREKLYVDDDGMIYIPSTSIKKCLIDGAKYWGEKYKGKSYATLVLQSLSVVTDLNLGIHRDETDKNKLDPFRCIVNLTPTGMKASKGPRTRPRISQWGGVFRVVVCDSRLSVESLKVIIGSAGIIGLGDYRGLGGFGKFSVESITEVGGKKSKSA